MHYPKSKLFDIDVNFTSPKNNFLDKEKKSKQSQIY